jgi:hypothetical protein
MQSKKGVNMSERTTQSIYDDLNSFNSEVVVLKTRDPNAYDTFLKIPTWKKNNIEDYASHIQGDIAKFFIHMNMLQQSDNLITDRSINETILSTLAEELTQHIQLYLSYKNNTRYQSLLTDLKNIKNILQKIMPANKLSRPPKSS